MLKKLGIQRLTNNKFLSRPYTIYKNYCKDIMNLKNRVQNNETSERKHKRKSLRLWIRLRYLENDTKTIMHKAIIEELNFKR